MASEHESRKEKGDKGNKGEDGQLGHIRLAFGTAPLPSLSVRILPERRQEGVVLSLSRPFFSHSTHSLQVSAAYHR